MSSIDKDGVKKTSFPKGKKYIVTGGGTGGHVYPAIAIADEIKRRDPSANFLYVGVKGKSEEQIVPKRGYPLKFVLSEGWVGGRSPIVLTRFFVKLFLGVIQSIFIILNFRPNVVIGTGGYVSAPIMLAAIFLKKLKLYNVPTFIHEQNTYPGKLNRSVGSMVDTVGVSFPESLRYFPKTGIYVGYPVRKELENSDVTSSRNALGIPINKKVVFVFGGSQGARTINRALVEALPKLFQRDDLFIIHGTGSYKGKAYNADVDTQHRIKSAGIYEDPDKYLRRDYFHNIEQVYAVANFSVCRGGAGTLTEIAARGIPSIVIPKANLPGDHQVKNARILAQAGASEIIYEHVTLTESGITEKVDGENLASYILKVLDDDEKRNQIGTAVKKYYKQDALEHISSVIAHLVDPSYTVSSWPQDSSYIASPNHDFESMGPVALVSYLERCERQNNLNLSDNDREYLKYRTDGYLASKNWQARNRGVKLVGLLKYHERIDHLLFLLRDKTPAPLSQRLLGGDYLQVGFIRRNIFEAIRRLGNPSDVIFDAILESLEDPYFEVRTQAAITAAFFSSSFFANNLQNFQSSIAVALRKRLNDPSFEVVLYSVKALGKISLDEKVLQDFRQFLYNKNWKIRQAIVEALGHLLERNIVYSKDVNVFLEEMLITSNGFQPLFPLKNELQKIGRLLRKKQTDPPRRNDP